MYRSSGLFYHSALGCRVSATMVAVWMLCEKYRFDLANLASVPTSLVLTFHIDIWMGRWFGCLLCLPLWESPPLGPLVREEGAAL